MIWIDLPLIYRENWGFHPLMVPFPRVQMAVNMMLYQNLMVLLVAASQIIDFSCQRPFILYQFQTTLLEVKNETVMFSRQSLETVYILIIDLSDHWLNFMLLVYQRLVVSSRRSQCIGITLAMLTSWTSVNYWNPNLVLIILCMSYPNVDYVRGGCRRDHHGPPAGLFAVEICQLQVFCHAGMCIILNV